MVAHLIAWIAQHKYNFFGALCNTSEADCKSVSRKNREYHAYCLSAQLSLNVLRDVLSCGIVCLRSCNY